MTVETKFSLGDEAWVLKRIMGSEACEFCSGKTEVKGDDGTSEFCPRCSGRGWIDGPSRLEVQPIVVAEIWVRLNKGLKVENYSDGHGSSFPRNHTYRTEAEAEKALKRNE